MKNLKLFVCSRSGNVGKSTLSQQFLKAMLPDGAKVYHIESMNDVIGEITSPKQLNDILLSIDMQPYSIVDVGSTNFHDIFEKLKRITNFSDFFDYYIVPTVADKKQQRDVIETLRNLVNDLQVPVHKIRVVFNKYENNAEDFSLISEAIKALEIPFSPVMIPNEELFGELDKRYIKDLNLDENQLAALQNEIDNETDMDKKRSLLSRRLYARRISALLANMTTSFKSMNMV
jgi:CobQ/CobB/MinD/ParA nucleotide binding domain